MTQETQENAAIAIYNTHHAAEEAIKALQRGGFDMTKLSIGAAITTPKNMWWDITTPATA